MQGFNRSNSCGPFAPHLWEYAAGTLQATPAEISRIESHLTLCPKCRAEVEAFRAAAAAMAQYASAPETGIPPRAPNWEAVQMRLGQNEREKTPVSGMSWLRAMRTSPAFAGPTAAVGLCTTLCAVAIPWGISENERRGQSSRNRGTMPVSVSAGNAMDDSVQPVFGSGDSPVEMSVRPLFMGLVGYTGLMSPPQGTYPLVATIVNHTGREVTANVSVISSGTSPQSRYEKNVRLREGRQPQVVLLYPSPGRVYSSRPELQVALEGPFPRQQATLAYPAYPAGGNSVSLVGDAGYGALIPKQQVMNDHRKAIRDVGPPSSTYLRYDATYMKPETAPDRTAGYSSTNTLVLGHGAERLNPAQRGAIRQWVIGGGSVIVLPGAGLDLVGIAPDAPFSTAGPVGRLLSPETPLHRYTLGMGTVLTVGVDLTQDAFREKWELPYVWNELRSRAAPMVSAANLSGQAAYGAYRYGLQSRDPFQVPLPPLATLVYLFTGYFVLAVPVTFVVLKQTRRMNWAWATGPTLAVVFGGAVYGFTGDLHRAKLSRRTSGLIISAAGERQARFEGTSELFFPTAGRYDVTVPGAETMRLGSPLRSNEGNEIGLREDESGGIVLRSLETVDNGTSVSVPALSVPNLAFRRLGHAQPVAWGEGITADLAWTKDGRIVGTIHNGTGRTLHNAYILWKTSPNERKTNNKIPNLIFFHRIVLKQAIAPGSMEIEQWDSVVGGPDVGSFSNGSTWLSGTNLFFPKGGTRTAPILVGTTSGDNLGPTIGQYVGGQNSVTVAVTLPPIQPASVTAVKGGAK